MLLMQKFTSLLTISFISFIPFTSMITLASVILLGMGVIILNIHIR